MGQFALEPHLGEDGQKYVDPNQVANCLNLDERGTNKRIDRRFTKGVAVMAVMTTPFGSKRLLNIKALPGLLYTTDVSRVAEEKRPVLKQMPADGVPRGHLRHQRHLTDHDRC